jgi:rRNA-processing protein FCF1
MDAGKRVLSIFAESIEALYIPLSVLQEVPKLSKREAERMGIAVLDTELDVLEEASRIKTGCSFNDNVCYLTAKKERIICATNDKHLRRVCSDAGIEVIWGLQIMIYLVQEGKISKKEALEIAKKIGMINSSITQKLIDEFERLIYE